MSSSSHAFVCIGCGAQFAEKRHLLQHLGAALGLVWEAGGLGAEACANHGPCVKYARRRALGSKKGARPRRKARGALRGTRVRIAKRPAGLVAYWAPTRGRGSVPPQLCDTSAVERAGLPLGSIAEAAAAVYEFRCADALQPLLTRAEQLVWYRFKAHLLYSTQWSV